MLNIEKYRAKLENYEIPLDCYIREIREKCKEENDSCGSKRCVECRKENIEWLLSEAQILDDAEKAYLSAVIKPFRKFVISIKKLESTDGWEIISFYSQNSQSCGCVTILPPFQSGTRFKGMELGKEYTLEELGL